MCWFPAARPEDPSGPLAFLAPLLALTVTFGHISSFVMSHAGGKDYGGQSQARLSLCSAAAIAPKTVLKDLSCLTALPYVSGKAYHYHYHTYFNVFQTPSQLAFAKNKAA